MNKILVSLFLLVFTLEAQSKCQLPRGEKLIIGCAFNCDFIYKSRLKFVAWQTGMQIQIKNMRSMGHMEDALEKVDAIVIPGGADINPLYYLDAVSEELRRYTEENLHLASISGESDYRDSYEYNLVKKYSDDEKFEKLPMLGICRGMQMMSVAQGIPLYLDIKTELGIKNRYNVFDRFHQEPDSLMSEFYGTRKMKGFKYHHQGLRVPYYQDNRDHYPQVKVSAYSHEGRIAEAIEYLNRPALGVQFHPEKSWNRTTYPIFKWLFTKACEYKNSKKDVP